MGIALITRAALGTSPISSLPFVLSLISPPSLGVYTFLFNMLFLGLEALLRHSFSLEQALQIPFTLLFSACMDGFMWLIPTQLYGPYPMKLLYLLAGCAILALGVTLEVFGGVIMLPGEALVRAISQRCHLPFHRVKVFFDCSLAAIAAILALLEDQKTVAEGAGAVSVAAVMFGKVDLVGRNTVCVVSGGNVDVTTLSRIITKGLSKTGRITEFTVKIADKPGSLVQLLRTISQTGANILRVNHAREDKHSDIGACVVTMVLETRNRQHVDDIERELQSFGYHILEK